MLVLWCYWVSCSASPELKPLTDLGSPELLTGCVSLLTMYCRICWYLRCSSPLLPWINEVSVLLWLPVFPLVSVEGDVSLTQASCWLSPVQVLGSWGGDPAKLRKQFELPGGVYPPSLAGGFSLWGAEMSIALSVGVANVWNVTCVLPGCWQLVH